MYNWPCIRKCTVGHALENSINIQNFHNISIQTDTHEINGIKRGDQTEG